MQERVVEPGAWEPGGKTYLASDHRATHSIRGGGGEEEKFILFLLIDLFCGALQYCYLQTADPKLKGNQEVYNGRGKRKGNHQDARGGACGLLEFLSSKKVIN